jgi:hypothetical protein
MSQIPVPANVLAPVYATRFPVTSSRHQPRAEAAL